jgi:putative hydrolase of the HAD superfamily
MTSVWRVHTVVFDVDDTLYDEKQFVEGGLAAVDAWLRARHGTVGFESVARRIFVSGRRGRIFNEALELLELPATPEFIAEMIGVYRGHSPKLQLLPDAEIALQWAIDSGLQIALITDGPASVQRRKIKALNLDQRILCQVVTDELGGENFWKPHPAAFLRVMDEYPGERDGYVYVADNPRKDFIAPRQLGWRTIRVRRPGGEHATCDASADENADLEVETLTVLPTILAP